MIREILDLVSEPLAMDVWRGVWLVGWSQNCVCEGILNKATRLMWLTKLELL